MNAERFVSLGSYTVTEQGALFRVRAGEQSGKPPVLFLHGIPSWSWLWRDVLAVTGTDRLSIAVDLPGFGMSEKHGQQDFHVAALAGALEEFIDREVGPDEPVALVTHDFGALVGAELIHRNPQRISELVITNTSFRAQAWIGGGPLRILGVPYLGDLSMGLARPWMLRRAMRPFVADEGAIYGERFDGYWHPFRHGFGLTLARFYRQRPVSAEDFERWRNALCTYQGRALVLWGLRDPAFREVEMQDILGLLPEAETMMVPGASHFLPEDAPKSTGRRIRSFLAGIPVS